MSLATTTYAKRTADLANIDNTELQALLDAATGLIENYCDRTFASTAYTSKQDGTGAQWIYVDNPPLISFTSVVIEDPDGTTETILAAQFRTDATAGKIWFKDDNNSSYVYFPVGFQNIQINYNGGYATIPAAVQRACLLATRALYAQAGGGMNAAFQSERMGEHNYTRVSAADDPLTMSVRALLAPYVMNRFV